MKKVSVIMATFNRGDLIETAIESVLRQTYDNWELIIVLDGCTDNTLRVIEGMEKNGRFDGKDVKWFDEPRFEYYTYVRNFGIEHSDGELLAFRDDDGAWAPTFLEKMVKPHKSDDVALTYCGRIGYQGIPFAKVGIKSIENGNLKGGKISIPQYRGEDSLSDSVDVGDIVIKRSVFDEDKGFTGFTEERDQPGYCSDAKLIDEIQRQNPHTKFIAIREHLHHYFLDHGAKTKNMTLRKLEYREKEGKLGPEEEAWEF